MTIFNNNNELHLLEYIFEVYSSILKMSTFTLTQVHFCEKRYFYFITTPLVTLYKYNTKML